MLQLFSQCRIWVHLIRIRSKRKLENGEQRPAPETFPARAEIPKITDQRLGRASLTRGNVAGSHTPGNNTTETEHDRDRAEALEPTARAVDDAFEFVQPVGAGRTVTSPM